MTPNSQIFEFISKIRDKEGRFILVKGNIYAPPGSGKMFFRKIFQMIASETWYSNMWRRPKYPSPTQTGHMHIEFDYYLQDDDNGEVSPHVLWDAFKAVIRWKLILLTSLRKKEKQKKLQELQEKIKDLEEQHRQKVNSHMLSQIQTVREEINKIYEDDVEKQVKFTKEIL